MARQNDMGVNQQYEHLLTSNIVAPQPIYLIEMRTNSENLMISRKNSIQTQVSTMIPVFIQFSLFHLLPVGIDSNFATKGNNIFNGFFLYTP